MHAGQVTVDAGTVRDLVAEHLPALRGLPVRALASSGTVNAIYRVGDRHAARFALVPGDPNALLTQLETEAAAARELHGRTRFLTPEPVAVVGPSELHGHPWSVQTWLPGTDATQHPPATRENFARDLTELITGIRAIPTAGRTFSGTGRGGELSAHDDWVRTCLVESAGLVDVDRLRAMWEELRTLPRPRDAMCHTDLIPGNLLVLEGRLVGVLDVGGLAPADPALDLVCAWHVLDRRTRRVLRAELGCDDVEWGRGRAWALQQALGLVWYYVRTNPVMARTGRRTLEQLIADP